MQMPNIPKAAVDFTKRHMPKPILALALAALVMGGGLFIGGISQESQMTEVFVGDCIGEECEDCLDPKRNVADAKKFAEIAHREATQGSSIAPKSYQDAMKEEALKTDPEATSPDKNWGGGCSEFVYWCLMEAGLKPGTELPTGYPLNTFDSMYLNPNPNLIVVHDLINGLEPGYIPQVGDIACQGIGVHFEVVTAVNQAEGTWSSATGGSETERTLDLSGNATEHDGYGKFVTILWSNINAKTSGHAADEQKACGGLEDVISYAESQAGIPWIPESSVARPGGQYAGSSCPGTTCSSFHMSGSPGFNCSGLVAWAFHMAGYTDVPCNQGHGSGSMLEIVKQNNGGSLKPPSELKRGDVAFFNVGSLTGSESSHVAIVTRPGYIIDSYTSSSENIHERPFPASLTGGGPLVSDGQSDCSEQKDECDCGEEWEDATDDAAVGDENAMMEANAKKIWQVFSAYGLPDEAIAGILSNFEAECGIDPTTIEAIYDSPYVMAGKKAPMKGSDEQSLKNLADWTEGGMAAAYAAGGPSLNWAFYNGGPDGRHYAGIGLGSWTGYDQVHDVYGRAHAAGIDWWNLDYQIAYLLCCDSNANPPNEQFWANYKSKVAGMGPTECAYWFYGTYEMPNFCGPSYYIPLHTKHADKWFQKMKGWSKDSAYAQSVLALAKKLSATATLSGLTSAADECETMSDKNTSAQVQGVIEAARKLIGKPYLWGVKPDPNSIPPGVDCNSLTWWCYQQIGFNIPYPSGHYCYGQFQWGKDTRTWKTSIAELEPGDVIFWSHDGGITPYHVGLYVGDGQTIHSPGGDPSVRQESVNNLPGFCGGYSPLDGPPYNG